MWIIFLLAFSHDIILCWPSVGIIVSIAASLNLLLRLFTKSTVQRKRAVIYFLCGMLGFVLAAGAFLVRQNRVSKEGKKIVLALEKYKSKNGGYPEELGELVPDFIDNIPQVKLGIRSKFFYEKKNQDSYSLILPIYMFAFMRYVPERDSWEVVD